MASASEYVSRPRVFAILSRKSEIARWSSPLASALDARFCSVPSRPASSPAASYSASDSS